MNNEERIAELESLTAELDQKIVDLSDAFRATGAENTALLQILISLLRVLPYDRPEAFASMTKGFDEYNKLAETMKMDEEHKLAIRTNFDRWMRLAVLPRTSFDQTKPSGPTK